MSVKEIPIIEIRENPVALRAVNLESEEFIGLRDSIAQNGIMNPISVREKMDEATSEIYYELIDGLHRFTAAREAGLEIIPVNILDLEDTQALEAQVMANVHKVETRPVEYTRQLQRIFTANPTMTVNDMATRLCKSPAWVAQRLGLLKLEPSVQKLVDDGQINLPNAYALAKLPQEEQVKFIDQAMTMGTAEFVPTINARTKELRDAARQGRSAAPAAFQAVPHCRKMGEIKAELDHPTAGPQLCAQQDLEDAAAGFALGVAWVLSVDPASILTQKAKYDARQKELEDAKARRKADRAKKAAEDAAAKAAEAQEAMAAAK